MRRTSARVAGALAFMLLALGVQASATAAGALPALAAVSIPQGGTISISGMVSSSASCPAGTPVQLTSTSTTAGANLFPGGIGPQAPRDASGNFKATFVIPSSTPVATYTIGLLCGTSVVGSTQTVTVTAGPQVAASVKVSPTSAAAGATVVVSGVVPTSGTVFCPSGDAAILTSTASLFPPAGMGPQATRDAGGNFKVSYKIPTATVAGSYSIGVRCGGGNVGVTAKLQVTATTTTTTTSTTSTTTAAATTTTTTTEGTTTTTVSPPATITIPLPTLPAITTTTVPAPAKKNHNPLKWLALALLVVVVVAAGVVLITRR